MLLLFVLLSFCAALVQHLFNTKKTLARPAMRTFINFLYFNMRTTFFASAPANSPDPVMHTLLYVPTIDDNGETVVELKDIDTIDDSIKKLKYSDFEIHNLLKAGVSLKSLSISPDTRLGVTDQMISDYSRRLEDVSEQMFESKN